MANIRAMAVFQGGSALPEDRYVNTFHFLSPSSYVIDSPLVATAVDTFYSTVHGSGAVGSFLSPYVSRDYEIRTYDMSTAAPRVPSIYEHALPAVNSGGPTANMPEEVAVCLSYHTIPPVTARRRGRIYLGPLCDAAGDPANTSAPTRVESQLRASVSLSAVALVNSGLGWAVYSPTGDTWGVIVAGWTDDAFDTQRRRGAAASTRTIWST